MTADPQLLTKQVISDDLDAQGITTSVGFQLPRGKVARIWGLQWNLSLPPNAFNEFSLFVRKTQNSPRQLTPKDILWSVILLHNIAATGSSAWGGKSIMFPKPHRTVGITVQMHADVTTSARGVLVVYYDIDEMIEGEATQVLEKSILRSRARRTREFD